MGKRVPPTFRYPPEKVKHNRVCQSRDKGHHNSRDRISQLPDEILVFILSFLTLREAASTSVLSCRWRYLWASIPRLDFDATKTLEEIFGERKLRDLETPKYINWVNRVIRQHRGLALEEFRIAFYLDKRSKRAIYFWLKFALSKRIQRLELDLSNGDGGKRRGSGCYTFPDGLLDQTRGALKHQSSSFCSLKPCTFVAFTSLRTLIFNCVNITQKVMDYILSNCPVLERLSLHSVRELVHVTVTGTSLRLKYLDVIYCYDLKGIEIYDSNIVSFTYKGEKRFLFLKNVPHLVELSTVIVTCTDIKTEINPFSCCLSQLELLTMNISSRIPQVHLFYKLTRLKQLVLQLIGDGNYSLLKFSSWINAAPYLQRFVLQLTWLSCSLKIREVQNAAESPHQHLKVVEFAGYYGHTRDVELILYFIENAVALEKIIINPRDQVPCIIPLDDSEILDEDARDRAKQQLVGIVPPEVELVIL